MPQQKPVDTRAEPLLYNPTPESKALKWEDLFPSTQNALEKILRWLDSACANTRSERNEEALARKFESVSTSILVSGDRGAGKTTVLISAAYAFRFANEVRNRDFFATREENRSARTEELRRILDAIREEVYWLDTLDLEPLHPNTNLLAAMLVRTRSAVEDAGLSELQDESERQRKRRRSIFESGLKTGERLERLVRDATFMWEGIPGSADPRRERADHQIRAAEISATFPREFRDIMEEAIQVIKDQGRKTEILVLPIDNVDRSIEHITNISKLIRLATSRRLWFLLAAVRPEYQLFLERSFQTELLGSNTITDPDSLDQTKAIARRQAATAVRRSLPDNYQIRIESLTPDQAWRYPRVRERAEATHAEGGENDEAKSLEALLSSACTPVPKGDGGERFKNLASLLNIRDQMEKDAKLDYLASAQGPEKPVPDELAPLFTGAAKMALRLSTRTLQDLRTALGQCDYKERENGDAAVAVSVRVLRNAIDESNLPFWAGQQLLERINRKDSNNSWVLDLSDNPIRRFKQSSHFLSVETPARLIEEAPCARDRDAKTQATKVGIEEKLYFQMYPDVVLELHDLGNQERSIPLPPVVAGWLMVLHDVLVLFGPSRVLSETSLPRQAFSGAVQSRHKICKDGGPVELRFEWGIPQWPTFAEHFIFAARWSAMLHNLKRCFASMESKLYSRKMGTCPKLDERFRIDIRSARQRSRRLHLAWIDNISLVCGRKYADNGWSALRNLAEEVAVDIEDVNPTAAQQSSQPDRVTLEYARSVWQKLCKLVEWSKEGALCNRRKVAWTWLREELPLLLMPEYSLNANRSGLRDLGAGDIDLMKWDGGDESTRRWWTYLQGVWREHCDGLRESRREGVREAVRDAIEAGCAETGVERAQGKDPEESIEKVVSEWFSAVDLSDPLPPRERWDSIEPLQLLMYA
jgi:hypothetical protein